VPELRSLRPLAGVDEHHFEAMDEDEFRRRYADTPFARPGLAGMRRNVRAAFASSPRQEGSP
jgi:hypothetical protein